VGPLNNECRCSVIATLPLYLCISWKVIIIWRKAFDLGHCMYICFTHCAVVYALCGLISYSLFHWSDCLIIGAASIYTSRGSVIGEWEWAYVVVQVACFISVCLLDQVITTLVQFHIFHTLYMHTIIWPHVHPCSLQCACAHGQMPSFSESAHAPCKFKGCKFVPFAFDTIYLLEALTNHPRSWTLSEQRSLWISPA
jgi:hypothetical protein